MQQLNKFLVIVAFLSSIVAAQRPCYANGDKYVGTGTAFGQDFSTKPCVDLGMGHLTSGVLYRCYSSLQPLGYSPPPISFADKAPIPYLVDIDSLLAKTEWRLEDIYYPDLSKTTDNTEFMLDIMPIMLVIISLSAVFIGLRGWEPNVDLNKKEVV